MKKIICTFLIILTLPIVAMADGSIAEILTQPAVFQADEPVPELKFFPLKISRKDILVISRKNNESSVTSLTYTITAETAVLTGSFAGDAKEMKAYIDLATGLKGLNPAKINVVIKDNTERVITDTDIPLVPLQ
jgi:hypothetical protein